MGVTGHRFDGIVCQCGRKHRLRRRGQVPQPQRRRRPENKPWTGTMKATPALVRYIRAAIASARAEGDHFIRCAHLLRAMGAGP